MPNRSRATLIGLGITGAVAVAVVAVYLTTLQSAHWPSAQRTAFLNSCNENCRKAPGVTPDRYPLCDKACHCAADKGEKALSTADLLAIEKAQASGTPTEEQKASMQKLSKLAMACVADALRSQK